MTKEEFKYLYDQYFDTIRNYIFYRCGNEELATDIVQETFLKVWDKQFKYDANKTKSLLYKIAGDLFVTHYRKQKLETNYQQEMKLKFKDGEDSNQIEYQELKRKYETVLQKLPEKQRVVFLMSRMDELSYKEIAERLKLSVKAVEKRMSQALKEMRSLLKE